MPVAMYVADVELFFCQKGSAVVSFYSGNSGLNHTAAQKDAKA